MNYPYHPQTQSPGYEQPSFWRRIGETFRSHRVIYAGIIGFLALRPALPLPYETEFADAVAAVANTEERQEVCNRPGRWPIRYLGGPKYCTDMNSVPSKLPAQDPQLLTGQGQQTDVENTNQSDSTVTSGSEVDPVESQTPTQPPQPNVTTGAS